MNGLALKNRTLWQDGSSTVNTEYLYNKLLDGGDIDRLFVEEITPEIKIYNQHTSQPLSVKKDLVPISREWKIPAFYKDMDVRLHVLKRLDEEIVVANFTDVEIEKRIARVQMELNLWETNNMIMLLAALIYIVDEFVSNNIVWGTGRGSSCSCYILYLIGLHDVDSVHYNLDIREFFRN